MRLSPAPALRVAQRNEAPPSDAGRYVLYWMTAFRRTRWNFALEHALARAQQLGRPLLVLEALRCDYPHASARLHRFVLDGMGDNARRFAAAGITYFPYVEPARGRSKGLLSALAAQAALVVGDTWPCFFLPSMVAAAARQLPVRLETVDSCGLLPLEAAPRTFSSAYAFRRFLQKTLPEHLSQRPVPDPLAGLRAGAGVRLPARLTARWPRAAESLLSRGGSGGKSAAALARLPIDAEVLPVAQAGGERAGRLALKRFVADRLAQYGERNEPDRNVTSGLSPYLHFGHVSAHEAAAAVWASEGWTAARLSERTDGHRAGWWGLSSAAEGFLDQLVTWRELGFNAQAHGPPGTSYAALPAWARRTLADHADDPRVPAYGRRALDAAATHDALWNAAQRQLRREGTIHNYLRMLWGKKVLEWSATPEQALDTLIWLNDRYAVDGRDPNSYNGILWTLGRFDRPWGPERPIFGSVRYMSSTNTRRKLDVRAYLLRHAPEGGPTPPRARLAFRPKRPRRKGRERPEASSQGLS